MSAYNEQLQISLLVKMYGIPEKVYSKIRIPFCLFPYRLTDTIQSITVLREPSLPQFKYPDPDHNYMFGWSI